MLADQTRLIIYGFEMVLVRVQYSSTNILLDVHAYHGSTGTRVYCIFS